MTKKLLLAMAVWLALGAAAQAAGTALEYDARLSGSAVYSDPAFQDFVETSYGYLSPRSTLKVRDAVAAAPAARPEAKAGKYVFVSIMLKKKDYAALLGQIEASAGFKMSGERTCRSNNLKKTCILGWVRADGLAAVRKNPLVARVSVKPAAL